jgi:hypothetical protein
MVKAKNRTRRYSGIDYCTKGNFSLLLRCLHFAVIISSTALLCTFTSTDKDSLCIHMNGVYFPRNLTRRLRVTPTWSKSVDLRLETATINSCFLPLRGQSSGCDIKAKLRGGSVSLITCLSPPIMLVSQGLGFGPGDECMPIEQHQHVNKGKIIKN